VTIPAPVGKYTVLNADGSTLKSPARYCSQCLLSKQAHCTQMSTDTRYKLRSELMLVHSIDSHRGPTSNSRSHTPYAPAVLTAVSTIFNLQGRNHVFKVGVQFLGLGYCTEQNTDGIPSFVHCSLQLHKKLGWSVQIFLEVSGPPRPPVVAPLPSSRADTLLPKICDDFWRDRKPPVPMAPEDLNPAVIVSVFVVLCDGRRRSWRLGRGPVVDQRGRGGPVGRGQWSGTGRPGGCDARRWTECRRSGQRHCRNYMRGDTSRNCFLLKLLKTIVPSFPNPPLQPLKYSVAVTL